MSRLSDKPAAVVPDAARIKTLLRERAGTRFSLLFLEFAIGAAATLVGPVFFAVMFWAIVAVWKMAFLPFWLVLLASVAVITPILFWTEIRTRGDFLIDAVEKAGQGLPTRGWFYMAGGPAIGFAPNMMMQAYEGRLEAAGLVEIMLWGPRECMAGLRRLMLMRHFRHIELDRETELLQRLAARPTGVLIQDLATTGEDESNVIRAVAYLAFYDWVGVGEREHKVWLLSETREKLGLAAAQDPKP